jgi:hypothetical protein
MIPTSQHFAPISARAIRALVLGSLLAACASAATLTVTGVSLATTPIANGFAINDGSNGGLSWTNMQVITDGVDTVTLSGDFTCSTACPDSTFAFSYSGIGFDTSYAEIASLDGSTGSLTDVFDGQIAYDNIDVQVDAELYLSPPDQSGPFALSAPPAQFTDSGDFMGGVSFNFASLNDGGSVTITAAEISFVQNTVPEPSSVLLIGAGLAAVAFGRRKIRRGMAGTH